ncbi:MAG TPA: hydantoinase/oxoprolinase N-terminal domain-containing protein, partial [Chloroflexota bacterium]
MLTIALDIGGTFTDLIAFDQQAGTIRHAKSSTTPYDLAVGIRETLSKSGLEFRQAHSFVHGSTTAINTAIERTGAKTALFTTEGMRDVYKIGRGNRPDAYDLHFRRPVPLVPRRLTLELEERLGPGGVVRAA